MLQHCSLEFGLYELLPSFCRNFRTKFNLFWCVIEPFTLQREGKIRYGQKSNTHQIFGGLENLCWIRSECFSSNVCFRYFYPKNVFLTVVENFFCENLSNIDQRYLTKSITPKDRFTCWIDKFHQKKKHSHLLHKIHYHTVHSVSICPNMLSK